MPTLAQAMDGAPATISSISKQRLCCFKKLLSDCVVAISISLSLFNFVFDLAAKKNSIHAKIATQSANDSQFPNHESLPGAFKIMNMSHPGTRYLQRWNLGQAASQPTSEPVTDPHRTTIRRIHFGGHVADTTEKAGSK